MTSQRARFRSHMLLRKQRHKQNKPRTDVAHFRGFHGRARSWSESLCATIFFKRELTWQWPEYHTRYQQLGFLRKKKKNDTYLSGYVPGEITATGLKRSKPALRCKRARGRRTKNHSTLNRRESHEGRRRPPQWQHRSFPGPGLQCPDVCSKARPPQPPNHTWLRPNLSHHQACDRPRAMWLHPSSPFRQLGLLQLEILPFEDGTVILKQTASLASAELIHLNQNPSRFTQPCRTFYRLDRSSTKATEVNVWRFHHLAWSLLGFLLHKNWNHKQARRHPGTTCLPL